MDGDFSRCRRSSTPTIVHSAGAIFRIVARDYSILALGAVFSIIGAVLRQSATISPFSGCRHNILYELVDMALNPKKTTAEFVEVFKKVLSNRRCIRLHDKPVVETDRNPNRRSKTPARGLFEYAVNIICCYRD